MTSAPVQLAGPLEETLHNHLPALAAFQRAVARSADLWRGVDRPDAPVPRLSWTAAETAAHVVGDLREYTTTLGNRTVDQPEQFGTGTESPSRRSAIVNANHLAVVKERNLRRLADMLEAAAGEYLVYAADDPGQDAPLATSNGLQIPPSVMTTLLLGEQLLHGLDISRASHQRWTISAADALLVIPGVLAVAPSYVRRSSRSRPPISFELRMRGGSRYHLAVHDGSATVSAAGEKADCTISADPVEFLLLGYGRIPQWSPIVRGKLWAGGKKPWLATKFGSLLSSP
jgi:hypothetical protein